MSTETSGSGPRWPGTSPRATFLFQAKARGGARRVVRGRWEARALLVGPAGFEPATF